MDLNESISTINLNWTNADGTHDGGVSGGIGFSIFWQRGPVNEAGRNGAFLIDVLWACYGQLNYFQESAYSCEENAEALKHLESCINLLEARRLRRMQNGILGMHEIGSNSQSI